MTKTRYLLWEATTVCPCKCLHCNRHESQKIVQKEPPVANYPDLWVLNVTGGEPFMRKDLAEQINKFNAKIVQISSCGWNPDRIIEIAKKIKGKKSVSISVDGFKNTHNKIRGGDFFANALKSNEELKKAGIRSMLQFTITDHNIDEVLPFYNSYPHTAFVVPVQGSFYGNPILQLKHKAKLLTILDFLRKNHPPFSIYRYYYNHVHNTLINNRTTDCLFKTGRAHYMNADNLYQRCHLADFDCSKCTQLCESILHPIFNTRQYLKEAR